MSNGQPKVALLAGASGLTGSYVLDALLDAPDFSRVIAVTRRPLAREHARLANRIVQFDRMETQLRGVACDVALCCLGTTLARAGSRDNFREVDVDYVVAFARTALAAHYPDRAAHVMSLIHEMRGGRDNDPRFGSRMRGTGPYAQLLRNRFKLACQRLKLNSTTRGALDTTRFQPPGPAGAQLRLGL